MTTQNVKALDANFNLIEIIAIKVKKGENALRKAVELYKESRPDIHYFQWA